MSEVTSVASWYGSNRILAPKVGEALGKLEFCGVPFAGGMAEVPHIRATTINVNDRHHHVVNLARAMASPTLGPRIYRRLRRCIFHPLALAAAQDYCRNGCMGLPTIVRMADWADERNAQFQEDWAYSYFITAWMARHSLAGTKTEFQTSMSTRWGASGGDSARHYQSAVRAINAWRRTLRRCNFTVLDFREFLKKCKDVEGHGVYSDSPFPGPGDKYLHSFTPKDHRDLAALLGAYQQARVVCRFYDVPLIRELYPEDKWEWTFLDGRKQTNDRAPEVLLCNRRAS